MGRSEADRQSQLGVVQYRARRRRSVCRVESGLITRARAGFATSATRAGRRLGDSGHLLCRRRCSQQAIHISLRFEQAFSKWRERRERKPARKGTGGGEEKGERRQERGKFAQSRMRRSGHPAEVGNVGGCHSAMALHWYSLLGSHEHMLG